MKSDKIKLIVAVVIFVAAAVIIAYNMGVFGGSSPAPQAPPAGQQPKGGPRAVTPDGK